ncbi:MAG: FeoA family protein [Nitrospiraceae bacterium]|nr:FeoA family protein [Nitrospiraceae bacterium]
MMPLGLLQDGEQALVVSIGGPARGGKDRCGAHGTGARAGACDAGGCNSGICDAGGKDDGAHDACAHGTGACGTGAHIEDMGIRAGKEVEMLKNPGRGPLLLKVDEARIAIGRAMAMRIFVRMPAGRRDPR